jgi:hypothetical protein
LAAQKVWYGRVRFSSILYQAIFDEKSVTLEISYVPPGNLNTKCSKFRRHISKLKQSHSSDVLILRPTGT